MEITLKYGYLYVGEDLAVEDVVTVDNKRVILLGNPYCMDKVGKRASDDIEKSCLSDIIDKTRNWTGRWILITDDFIVTDACGLMSAFYYNDNGEYLVSSSLALLADVLEIKIKRKVRSVGLTWQLLPETLVDGVKALFCTQILTLNNKKALPEYFDRFVDKSSLSTEQKICAIADMLMVGMQNIALYSERNIKIALTAGKDSRLTLAAALASKLNFQTYTSKHANISEADKKLPYKIAKDLGFDHILIKKRKDSCSADDYFRFCGNNSNGADLEFYRNGQFSQFSSDDIIVRSGIFETGQKYGRTIGSENLDDFIAGFTKYYDNSLSNSIQKKALSEWKEYVVENPIPFIDIRDRFYVEQRVNGWVSAIEQSLCINSFESVQIANCAELVSILLSATEAERENLILSYGPIKVMCPKLLEYPCNKAVIKDKVRLIKNFIFKILMRK